MKKLILASTVALTLTVAQAFSQCNVSLQVTNAKCANSCDGVITATPSSGTPPYTYSWNPFGETTQTITGLCPWWPDYIVTVTDNIGCTTTATATITAPQAIYITQTSAFSCTAGTGTASVTASGGIPPYTYNWNPSGQSTQTATGLSIGTYTATVTDSNSCTTISTVTVAPISATFKVNYTSACKGKPFFFTDQSAGNPIQWYWNMGDGYTSTIKNPWHSYNSPGTFTVSLIVTNGFGCKDTTQITLLNNPIPQPSYSVAPNLCIGDSTCFTNLSTIAWGNIAVYNWDFGEPSSGNNTSTLQNPCHVYSSAGYFTVTLETISDSGCQHKLISGITVNTCIGVQNISENKSINISPNPFCSQTVLRTDNLLHNATLTVDNCFGQTVAQIKNINGQTVVFSRDNLASGLYFVRLTEDNKIFTDKLIITDK